MRERPLLNYIAWHSDLCYGIWNKLPVLTAWQWLLVVNSLWKKKKWKWNASGSCTLQVIHQTRVLSQDLLFLSCIYSCWGFDAVMLSQDLLSLICKPTLPTIDLILIGSNQVQRTLCGHWRQQCCFINVQEHGLQWWTLCPPCKDVLKWSCVLLLCCAHVSALGIKLHRRTVRSLPSLRRVAEYPIGVLKKNTQRSPDSLWQGRYRLSQGCKTSLGCI